MVNTRDLSERIVCNLPTEVIAVAFWPLNAKSLMQDESGNGNHGAATGATLDLNGSGDVCSAYRFDGTANSYIEFPNNGGYDTVHSITMLVFVYPTGTAGPVFMFKRDDWGVHLWQNSPTQVLVMFTTRDLQLTTHVVADVFKPNDWNFLGATYDYQSGIAKLWLDGVVVASSNMSSIELSTQYEARMGARIGDPRYFAGMITCMQIYDQALSSSESQKAREKCELCPG